MNRARFFLQNNRSYATMKTKKVTALLRVREARRVFWFPWSWWKASPFLDFRTRQGQQQRPRSRKPPISRTSARNH